MNEFFQPVVIERANKSQRIVSQIRQLLADDKLKAGEKLPPERELARVFNVSRTSVREAIKTLAALDLAVIKKGSGVFVKEAMLGSYINNVADTLVISRDEVRMLFEIRKVLETQAAAWAAQRATDSEIAELAGLILEVKFFKLNKINAELAREHDKKFHSTIIKLSHNEVLARIISGMFDVLDKIRITTATLPGRAAQSINDHGAIVKAIAMRDPERAMKAMHNHIESVERTLVINV